SCLNVVRHIYTPEDIARRRSGRRRSLFDIDVKVRGRAGQELADRTRAIDEGGCRILLLSHWDRTDSAGHIRARYLNVDRRISRIRDSTCSVKRTSILAIIERSEVDGRGIDIKSIQRE